VKKYILTGGTGFLGPFLAVKLLQQGDRIVFIGRSNNGASLRERVLEALKEIKENFYSCIWEIFQMKLKKGSLMKKLSSFKKRPR